MVTKAGGGGFQDAKSVTSKLQVEAIQLSREHNRLRSADMVRQSVSWLLRGRMLLLFARSICAGKLMQFWTLDLKHASLDIVRITTISQSCFIY